MNSEKMDTSAVYALFEEIKESLKQNDGNKLVEPAQLDMTAVNAMAEQFENLIEEVRKPTKVEHRHVIDIGSSKVFLSMVVMVITILSLAFSIGNQREIINQYQDNDLKYRYIKMQGQMSEENLYRLERQFWYRDGITIIRKQVEKYEHLVKEQAEKIERVRQNSEEVERLQEEVEALKESK
ncbi:hypothetical protein EZS27_016167 [termite gut metagenome]|uniref:Uncharacterized protein n=1 Tax=termite gut metagenome TaxID=433724 RepID=A0A5J4RQB6_9ZZZZ